MLLYKILYYLKYSQKKDYNKYNFLNIKFKI